MVTDTGISQPLFMVYGLAFFVLGLAVSVRAFAFPPSLVRTRFLALGAFGLIHGVFEWSVMAKLFWGWSVPYVVDQGVAAGSFVFLGYFGIRGLGGSHRVFVTTLSAITTIWIIVAIQFKDPVVLESVTRLGMAVPASIVSALSFFRMDMLKVRGGLERVALYTAVIAFVGYAFTQMFVTPAEFFPASVLNTDQFQTFTGLSILTARTFCAILMVVSVLVLLQAFDHTIREFAENKVRQVHDQLAMSRTMLQSVFDLVPTGIVISRLDSGKFVQGNSAIIGPTGYSVEEFESLVFDDLMPEDQARDEMKMVESGRFGPLEEQFTRKDGTQYPVLIQGVSLKDENGDELLLSAVQDITVQKRHQSEIEKHRQLAEAANVAKTQFLANMSHEIRTPLNGMLGMVSILSGLKLDADHDRLVRIIKDSGEVLLGIINDILDLSRIEADQLLMESRAFSIHKLSARVEDFHKYKAEEQGIDLNFIMKGDFEKAYLGDPNRIMQILNNLTSNAIKFTNSGSVDVTFSADTPFDNKSRIMLEVRDSGIGMSREQLERVFDRFTQADATTTREYGGSGLGLSIVRGLVDMMDGEIDFDSEEGKGSVFRVFLPLEVCRDDDEDEPVSEEIVKARLDRQIAILVAEDNEINRYTFQATLKEDDFIITFANNGREAVDKAETNRFDVILMDIQMPVLGGVQALSLIRDRETKENLPRTPVIACTANAYEEDLSRYHQFGFDAVITKPFDPEKLNSVLQAQVCKTEAKIKSMN